MSILSLNFSLTVSNLFPIDFDLTYHNPAGAYFPSLRKIFKKVKSLFAEQKKVSNIGLLRGVADCS